MMSRFRIKKTMFKSGSSSFQVQGLALFGWYDYNPPLGFRCYGTLKEAQKEIAIIKGRKADKIEYYY